MICFEDVNATTGSSANGLKSLTRNLRDAKRRRQRRLTA